MINNHIRVLLLLLPPHRSVVVVVHSDEKPDMVITETGGVLRRDEKTVRGQWEATVVPRVLAGGWVGG